MLCLYLSISISIVNVPLKPFLIILVSDDFLNDIPNAPCVVDVTGSDFLNEYENLLFDELNTVAFTPTFNSSNVQFKGIVPPV